MKYPLPGFLLLLLIAVSETAGSVFLIREQLIQPLWWGALTGHVLLSAFAGLGGLIVLHASYPTQGTSVFIFFSLFALCIPVLGSLGVLCLIGMFYYLGTARIPMAIGIVNDPEFSRGGQTHAFHYQSGDVRSLVSNSSVSDMQRMQALFKLQSLQSRQTAQAFRSLLTDTSEDLRLVAFGLLDKTEKTIFSRIHQELTLLENTVTEEHKVEHWRQLAYMYWELVYLQAAVGDVLTFARDQVREYATKVLFQEERDGGMWSLLGHLNLQEQDYAIAGYCFSQACAWGMPESRVLPYMAEVLFKQRNFFDLQSLVAIQSGTTELASFQCVLDYWGNPQPAMETKNHVLV